MSKYKGRELRIKVRTSTGPDVLRLLKGGIHTESMTINSETVDVQTKTVTKGGARMLEVQGITNELKRLRRWYLIMPFYRPHYGCKNGKSHLVLKLESGFGDVWQGRRSNPVG